MAVIIWATKIITKYLFLYILLSLNVKISKLMTEKNRIPKPLVKYSLPGLITMASLKDLSFELIPYEINIVIIINVKIILKPLIILAFLL